MLRIRPATNEDKEGIWLILEPIIRVGETYTLPCELSKESALAYWFAEGHDVFVAQEGTQILGTYYLRANQQGGGSHVANCGYMTDQNATGRGIASAMCSHSLDRARERGFKSMQFNFVVSTNDRAVRLWQRHGFEIVGRLPTAFCHPQEGLVDAFVMFRDL